jgi:TRAP-type mannitol/chloroaromatic compound transport system substrate-binding protein
MDFLKKKVDKEAAPTRRKFLSGAAAASVGTVALGFPMIAKAQGPITMRWQSTWPTKDIFHEFALDYAKKVNDMTGGDLKIEVLPAGSVVPAFGLLDAVSKGTLDGGHGVLVYHYGKQNALALWGSSPCFAMDANQVLSWHMLQSYHQSGEQFEITFNKTKFDALPTKMKAIIENAVEAASQDLMWKSIDRYSQDHIKLQTEDKVKMYKTPDSVLQRQLEIFDQVVAKRSADNPLFKEVVESQKKYAERAVRWRLDVVVDPRMAYNYYFGKKPAPKKA